MGGQGAASPSVRLPGASAQSPTHPAGPVRPPEAFPGRGLGSSGKGRDYGYILRKLVKTAKCHRKVSIRPAVVPVCQNGVGKSPLEFLRFPIWLAFSHKELMVPFGALAGLYCQNDEVSTVCTGRLVCADTPTATSAS